nr:hypothetical protein [Abyssibacter sp.]
MNMRPIQRRHRPLAMGLLVGLLLCIMQPAMAGSETHRRQLNEGYSLLYADVAGLRRTDLLLLVKLETDSVQQTVRRIADEMADMHDRLETWAAADTALRLDLQPLPRVEREKQAAAAADRLQSFAPWVGRTGPGFERTLLLTLSGALNQLRHLTRVLAEVEAEFGLSNASQRGAAMTAASGRLDALYDAVLTLLEHDYYVHGTGQSHGR